MPLQGKYCCRGFYSAGSPNVWPIIDLIEVTCTLLHVRESCVYSFGLSFIIDFSGRSMCVDMSDILNIELASLIAPIIAEAAAAPSGCGMATL